MREERVVITGAGLVCSLGRNAQEVWEALCSGKTGIKPIEGFDPVGFGCTFAGQVQPLDPAGLGIHPRDSRIMDTHSYLLMKACRDAVVQSDIERGEKGGKGSVPREEIGFYAGMGMVDYEIEDLLPAVLKSLNGNGDLDYSAFYTKGFTEIYPLWPLSMLNNIGFCQVAMSLDLQGDNTVFSPHADSGAMAVAEGMKALWDGRARVVVCGGVGEKVSPLSLGRARLSGILNTAAPQASELCKPFDVRRKGTVLGEGCGVIVLELESSARERGVPALASMAGYGSACEIEGRSSGPTARAFTVSMRGALERAGLKPSDIDVVIAHGEGSVTGDLHEAEAIHTVFSDCIDRVHVFSSKGSLGHLLAGAPLADAILGALMLRTGVVPRTLHTSSPDPAIRFPLVYRDPVRVEPRRILVNCQSYEGQAASLVMEAAGA
jgi:3-oxoacyl-[acyl-carrier-protein] synthase II